MTYKQQLEGALISERAHTAMDICKRVKDKIREAMETASAKSRLAETIAEKQYYEGLWMGLEQACGKLMDVCYDRDMLWSRREVYGYEKKDT